jgi:hypothetical protein
MTPIIIKRKELILNFKSTSINPTFISGRILTWKEGSDILSEEQESNLFKHLYGL